MKRTLALLLAVLMIISMLTFPATAADAGTAITPETVGEDGINADTVITIYDEPVVTTVGTKANLLAGLPANDAGNQIYTAQTTGARGLAFILKVEGCGPEETILGKFFMKVTAQRITATDAETGEKTYSDPETKNCSWNGNWVNDGYSTNSYVVGDGYYIYWFPFRNIDNGWTNVETVEGVTTLDEANIFHQYGALGNNRAGRIVANPDITVSCLGIIEGSIDAYDVIAYNKQTEAYEAVSSGVSLNALSGGNTAQWSKVAPPDELFGIVYGAGENEYVSSWTDRDGNAIDGSFESLLGTKVVVPVYSTYDPADVKTLTFVDEKGEAIGECGFLNGAGVVSGEIPADPAKAGDGVLSYEFSGWSTDGENVIDVTSVEYEGDTTLKPVYYTYGAYYNSDAVTLPVVSSTVTETVDETKTTTDDSGNTTEYVTKTITVTTTYPDAEPVTETTSIIYTKTTAADGTVTTKYVANSATNKLTALNVLPGSVTVDPLANGVTLIYKVDGIESETIVDNLSISILGKTNASSWHWDNANYSNDGLAPCQMNLENGYFYLYLNDIINGLDGIYDVTKTIFTEFELFHGAVNQTISSEDGSLRGPVNANENATFQMLAVTSDNLQPTVTFHDAEGNVLSTYQHKYTNVTSSIGAGSGTAQKASSANGTLLTQAEVIELAKAADANLVDPEKADKEDGTERYRFIGWADADGNTVDALYYDVDLYPVYETLTDDGTRYTVTFVDEDGNTLGTAQGSNFLGLIGDVPEIADYTDGVVVYSHTGWTVDGVTADPTTYAYTGDVTFTAVYESVHGAHFDSEAVVLPQVSSEITETVDETKTTVDDSGNTTEYVTKTITVTTTYPGEEPVVSTSSIIYTRVTNTEGVVTKSAYQANSAKTTQTALNVLPESVTIDPNAVGVTFVYKVDGVESELIADNLAISLGGKPNGSWHWDNANYSNDGLAPCQINLENGYFYIYFNQNITGQSATNTNLTGFMLFHGAVNQSISSEDGSLRGPVNANENATFQMLAVTSDNLQPTVNFFTEDGETLGSYTHKYTNVTAYLNYGIKPDSCLNGELLSAKDIAELAGIVAPEKAADEENVYVFKGWEDADGNLIDAVYYNVDVYPSFEVYPKTTTNTVTFVNGDETFATSEVYYLDVAVAPEGTPTKADNATGKFTFAGWSTTEDGEPVDLSEIRITEATTFWAVYTYEDVTFTVTYYNGTSKMYTETVIRSQAAVYDGIPTKATDKYVEGADGYYYTFSQWEIASTDDEGNDIMVKADLTNIQADTVVYAAFDATLVENWWTVTWVDTDGTTLATATVADGEGASTSAKGKLNGTATETVWYTFSGWDTDTTAVTSDLTVTIVYTETAVATGANTVIAEGSGTVGTANQLVSSDAPYTFSNTTTKTMTFIFDIVGASEENPISIGGIRTGLINGTTGIDSNNSGNYTQTNAALRNVTEDGKYYVTIGHYTLTWVGSAYEIINNLTIDDTGATRGGKSSGEGTYDVTLIEGTLEPTVRFYDAEGNWLYTGKYTYSTNSWSYTYGKVPTADAIYKGAEIENFEAWVDADGNVVTDVTENMDVYAKVTVTESDILWGDVNDDGYIDGTDAMLLNRYASGWAESDYANATELMTRGDINADGTVDGTDAMLLNRYASGWAESDYANAVNLLAALATLG